MIITFKLNYMLSKVCECRASYVNYTQEFCHLA